jgi:hypothetical protein
MNVKATVDLRQWTAAARALKETSSRTAVDFINGQALKVAIESVRQTEKANRTAIAWRLGLIGRSVEFKKRLRNTKSGAKGTYRTVKGKALVKENSFAERILGKRFKDTGKFGIKGETMADRVRNFIAARTRSAGFIASGWIGSRNALFSIVKKKATGTKTIADAKQYGKAKGGATPARFSLRSIINAEIFNKALMSMMGKIPATGGNPLPIANKGLQAAINIAAKDMTEELARRLRPDFKKVSAK